jgi:ligand-binding sensor domain-containing protein
MSLRLLSLCLLLYSCSSQPGNSVGKNVNVPSGRTDVTLPELPRTQGADKFTNICCAVQDGRGNLWFGSSAEGVYRFDGISFEQFTMNDGLSSNIVKCLFVDQSDHLWIGTSNGICKYNGTTIEKFPILVPDPSVLINSQPPKTNEVWNILQDRNGKFWFATTMGVFTYDGTKFSQFPNDYSVINNDKLGLKMVCDILEDRDGNIWFTSGTTEGVMKYDGKSITGSRPNGDGWVRTMMPDQQGKIWFNGRHNGVFIFDNNDFYLFKEKEKIGSAMLQDSKGNIWFSGEEHENGYSGVNGIWCFDGTNFISFTEKDGLGNYGVWCMLEDSKGHIWFGTRNNGLYKYDGSAFVSYSE